MTRIPRAIAWALVLALVPGAAAGARLVSTRALLAGLRAHGRAEAEVRLERENPLTGRADAARGRLALEQPGYARLEFPATGECLTLREDGGDWLQPAPRQLVRAGARAAGVAMRWWAALLDSGAAFREQPLGGRGYRVAPLGAGADQAIAQRVWLGTDGLPARVEIATEAGETQRYVLRRWRFTRARGRAGFVLAAPPGFETVELP
jgi:hypothetical protein